MSTLKTTVKLGGGIGFSGVVSYGGYSVYDAKNPRLSKYLEGSDFKPLDIYSNDKEWQSLIQIYSLEESRIFRNPAIFNPKIETERRIIRTPNSEEIIAFKNTCRNLLARRNVNDLDEFKKQAKIWCEQYTTIEEFIKETNNEIPRSLEESDKSENEDLKSFLGQHDYGDDISFLVKDFKGVGKDSTDETVEKLKAACKEALKVNTGNENFAYYWKSAKNLCTKYEEVRKDT